jgi:hypothetical protein
MKIINETVYNDDDLYNLYRAVERLCWRATEQQVARWKQSAKARGQVWAHHDYYDEQPLPKEIRIGYRSTPKRKKDDDVDALKQTEPSFTTIRGRRTNSPRFGIVRPSDLPLCPLVILAQCAEDAHRALPREVVQSVARIFAKSRRGNPTDDDFSYLVDDHQITFTLAVTQEAKAAAKAASKKARIASLRFKIDVKQDEIKATLATLDKRRDQLATLETRMAKLNPKQEMSLRV